MLFIGFALIFVYIAAVLGRWNPVEQRVRMNKKATLMRRSTVLSLPLQLVLPAMSISFSPHVQTISVMAQSHKKLRPYF